MVKINKQNWQDILVVLVMIIYVAPIVYFKYGSLEWGLFPKWTQYFYSFLAGLTVVESLHMIVGKIMDYLKKKGDVYSDKVRDERIGLSPTFGRIEKILFYLAAIAGKEIFGFAAGGWLVFKGIQKWSAWDSTIMLEKMKKVSDIDREMRERAKNIGIDPIRYIEATERNRFMIFVIGTGMSIAAGGISGAFYLWINGKF